MPRTKPRGSRRAPPLKDSDYDHQISLVDNAPDDDEDDGDGGDDAPDGNALGGGDGPVVAEQAAGPAEVTGLGGGDAAADDADVGADVGADADDASRRPSALSIPPAAATGAALSPAITATSTTPLLLALESSASAAASGGAARPSYRGQHPSSQYGSLLEVPAQVDGPSDADAGPSDNVPNGDGGGKGKAKEPQQPQQQQQQKQQQQPPLLQQQEPPAQPQPQAQPPQPAAGRTSMQSARSAEPETAIDILYENERGGFLCGIPLFSKQALGNLDPSPWTNFAHGTSPTDIYTAQVPDPSWEWAWPEWRINHDEGVDEDGWQYSFMFARCFAWHGPTWYNSFVRRRVWIRKRVRRRRSVAASAAASATGLVEAGGSRGSVRVSNPNLLNPDYFTVVSAASMRRSSSRASSSRVGSRLSVAGAPTSSAPSRKSVDGRSEDGIDSDGNGDGDGNTRFAMPREIRDADVLMRLVRVARIDREKIEAVDNFLAHAGEDLVRLQDCMHEIMALFVFQASRRTLLTHLTTAHADAVRARDQAVREAETAEGLRQSAPGSTEPAAAATSSQASASPAGEATHDLQVLERRVDHLTAALKHANEEVRRLEFWSDIKAMAEHGAAAGAVGRGGGWDAQQWQGVDQSGPAPPRVKTPSSKTG